jgi:hypothetical protein
MCGWVRAGERIAYTSRSMLLCCILLTVEAANVPLFSQIAVQKRNQFFEVRLIDKQPWSLNYISRNGLLLLCSGLA